MGTRTNEELVQQHLEAVREERLAWESRPKLTCPACGGTCEQDEKIYSNGYTLRMWRCSKCDQRYVGGA